MAHIATYKVGGIAVPLFVLFGPEALQFRLHDSGAKVLITNQASLASIAQIHDKLPALQHILVTDTASDAKLPTLSKQVAVHSFWNAMQQGSQSFTPVQTKADDPALIIYTSGTTGNPKGCLHAHRVLPGHMPGVEFPHNFFPQPDDLFWTPADWAWIGGLFDVLLSSLLHGVPVLAHRSQKFDAQEAYHIMAKHHVKNVFMPPTALKLMKLVDVPSNCNFKLRSIGSGGESLGESMLEWGKKTFGVDINEFYGQTEMNLLIGNCGDLMPVIPGSMGRAIPGRKLEIIDEEGNVKQNGQIGIVGAKADPVTFLRYWNNPEATKKKFTPNGFLITGDLAKRDDQGYFYFVGREDDLINSAGYRIGPSEIEDCLLKHASVSVCAAVGTPDEIRNEVVKAFIVLKKGYEPSDALVKDLQNHVKTRLAAHEYPRHIEFVTELPMTTTGKIQRKVLREQEYKKYHAK